MLAMTLRSYLRQPVRPVMFVPVYIGYERVIEIDSYVRELSGKPKEKESLWGFLRSLRRLRENFGQVHMNIGEPIALTPLLDEHLPDWRTRVGEASRGGMGATVDVLAQRIMRNIHAAAAVTPVNLLALAMLATPRQAMLERDLYRQLATYLAILRAAPYSARMTVTALDAAAIIELGLARGLLARADADTLALAPGQAAALTWYRNNVLHLVALPSLLACCFLSTESHHEADLLRIVQRLYPYLRAELFLHWDEADLETAMRGQLAALRDAGLLASNGGQWRAAPADSSEAMQLSLLAQPMLQAIERYYLVVSLLLRASPGSIEQAELAQRCQEMATRMRTLYGFYSPEFFDRTLFDGFVGLLRRQGVIRADADSRLVFGEELALIAGDVRVVLSEQLRHSFLQVLHG
jgi:glycerol-3-phosphate O-acyltransferase